MRDTHTFLIGLIGLIGLIALAACSDKADHTAAGVGGAVPGARAGSDAESKPPSRREDLSKLAQPIAASIQVPLGAEVTSGTEERRDRDGLRYDAPVAKITRGEGSLGVMADVEYGVAPTTLEAELIDRTRSNREVVGQRQAPTGEWAIAYKWSEDDCAVRGWSPRARLLCVAADAKVKCSETGWLLDACITLEPSGPTVPPPARRLIGHRVDALATAVAVTTARAIANDDREALLGVVHPRGLVLKGKKLTHAALRDLLRTESLRAAIELDCRPLQNSRSATCAWNTDGTGDDGKLIVLPYNSSGVMPQFTFAREGESTWRLTRIVNVDIADD